MFMGHTAHVIAIQRIAEQRQILSRYRTIGLVASLLLGACAAAQPDDSQRIPADIMKRTVNDAQNIVLSRLITPRAASFQEPKIYQDVDSYIVCGRFNLISKSDAAPSWWDYFFTRPDTKITSWRFIVASHDMVIIEPEVAGGERAMTSLWGSFCHRWA